MSPGDHRSPGHLPDGPTANVALPHHAQAAENWGLASRLLADNWRSLYLDGRLATRRELLSRFPADTLGTDPGLAAAAASDRRAAGSLQEAERYLALAERMARRCPKIAGGASRSRSRSCDWRSREIATIRTPSPKRHGKCSRWPTVQR